MSLRAIHLWQMALLGLLVAGCNQSPFLANSPPPTLWQQQQGAGASHPYTSQLQDLDRRAAALDADNRELHAQIARFQQEKQLLQDELKLVRQRLEETTNQLREAQLAQQKAEQKVRTIEASMRQRGGAMIRANNSVQNALRIVDIPGFEVRMEDDVIRVEVPADRLFQPHTAQILPSAGYLLDPLVDTIARNYPRQLVAIEGHTDNTPLGATSSHELTASQTVAVFRVLTERNRIPPQQLFLVAHGANHPLVSNATASGRSKNRRIELVIYPETVDGT